MSSVDVIVPCYQYGRYLRECVDSVLSQEGVEVRVLIIDDESPDDTPEVSHALARADTRVMYRRHERNLRHIATYNEGIDWVRAEYYLLLSADDYLLPGALERATKIMDADSRVGLCYGRALELLPDATSRPAPIGLSSGTTDKGSCVMDGLEFIDLCRQNGSNNVVPTPTAVVRSVLQKRLEGYRPELPHSGDFELWLRLAAHGAVGFVDADQAVYRRHPGNMSLSYQGENHLLDLQQRCEAVDWFCRSCNEHVPDANNLRRGLLQPLAREAMRSASAAFNDDKRAVCSQLVGFALRADPQVRWSMLWYILMAKRLLGRETSLAMLRVSHAVRHRVTKASR